MSIAGPPRTPAGAAATASSRFVASLRTGPDVIRISGGSEPSITIRVEVPEVWDTVRVETPSSEPVAGVKTRALAALYPDASGVEDFVTKLNGFEVRDERRSLAEVGVKDGSTLLVTFRRRRPVRS